MNLKNTEPKRDATDALKNSIEFAKVVRTHILKMVAAAKASHIGGALSVTDILSVLYCEVLRQDAQNPKWPERDRLIYSKGHCCTALYASLAEKGFFPVSELESYGKNGSRLLSHVSHHVPGVEFSTGSLGHGLPFATGIALAAKRKELCWKTYAILSDGELDEGSNWEAILFSSHHGLNNLTTIIDYNKIQSLGNVSDVLSLEPLRQKFEAFGWEVIEIDGHNHQEIELTLSSDRSGKVSPLCVIAHTIKGKGVRFMENDLKWHYSPPSSEQLEMALSEINRV
jgi:transketolase